MRLAACIKSVADQVESLGLSANSKPYQSHFKTLQMACAPMGIDPLHLKERDQNYISLFFVLSRSIHSLDGFWSAIKSIYNLNKRDFPDSKSHRAFKKVLRKLFLAADTYSQASLGNATRGFQGFNPFVNSTLRSGLDINEKNRS